MLYITDLNESWTKCAGAEMIFTEDYYCSLRQLPEAFVGRAAYSKVDAIPLDAEINTRILHR